MMFLLKAISCRYPAHDVDGYLTSIHVFYGNIPGETVVFYVWLIDNREQNT